MGQYRYLRRSFHFQAIGTPLDREADFTGLIGLKIQGLLTLNQIFLILDAMGLVAFTIIGCNVSLKLGYETPVVIMAGITTGIFGGILRDIMCNRTPQVLRHELYASVSLVVAVVYLYLKSLGVSDDTNTLASFSFGLALRLAAIRWKLSLPVFSYSPGRWGD